MSLESAMNCTYRLASRKKRETAVNERLPPKTIENPWFEEKPKEDRAKTLTVRRAFINYLELCRIRAVFLKRFSLQSADETKRDNPLRRAPDCGYQRRTLRRSHAHKKVIETAHAHLYIYPKTQQIPFHISHVPDQHRG
jgi:hypothetical protein